MAYIQPEKNLRIISAICREAPLGRLHKNLHEGSSSRRNQPCQILSQSDQGF